MPQGTRNVKKVSETTFPKIKSYVAKHGVEAAQAEFGYSARTLRSIANAADYNSWRDKRRQVDFKRKAKATAQTPKAPAPVEPQAIQSVTPSQSVTTPPIKKPGHARDFTLPKKTPPTEYVTKEQHDRDMRNQAALSNRALEQIAKVVKEVEYLTKEDTAYKQADIVILDKASKSRWTKFREWLARNRS